MRRTVTQDFDFEGQKIKAGEKAIMWCASGDQDELSIPDPKGFTIDRARNHIFVGFGLHRCRGNRMAELQLRVLWEAIQKRF